MKSRPNRIVIGVDPGTGSKSPLGLSIFNPDTREIYLAEKVNTDFKKLEHRIKDISDVVEAKLLEAELEYEEAEVYVYIESFVMRGKSGETLQRMIGSLMGRVPYTFKLSHVQNTSVKLVLAEHGHADKKAVAEGVCYYFNSNKAARHLIRDMIEDSRQSNWDILDSLAIGIAGWELENL